MTFRIFQVTTDGVALPVYKDGDTASPPPPPTPRQDAASHEWKELRERLREKAPSPRPRKSWLKGS